jgi:putative hydrolase of the HAD superfamily
MTPWLVSVWENNKDVTHIDQLRFIINAASKSVVSMKDDWVHDLSEAYVSPFFEMPPSLNPDVQQVLHWLKDHNIRIGLISNIGRTPGFCIRRFLEQEEVADYFDLMLFSDEIGIRKPDSQIFNIVTQKLSVKPNEVIHIGDNLKSDVWGAQQAGFRAIYFSTKIAIDKEAETDPTSLFAISRNLGKLKQSEIVPDRTISSFKDLIEAIKYFDK